MTGRDRSVLFDSQVFAEQAHGGVSRYFSELAVHLAARSVWDPVIFGGLHIGMLPPIKKVGPHFRLPAMKRGVRLLNSVNRSTLGLLGSRLAANAAVVHPTWYDLASVERLAGPPLVITVHDLIPEHWPNVTTPEQLRQRRRCFELARRIICVSRATLERLDRFYGSEISAKSSVIYLGAPPALPGATIRPSRRPYLVYVGKRGSYKDFGTVTRALAELGDGPELIAIGGGGGRDSEIERLKQLGVHSRVTFLGNTPADLLDDLIGGAMALVSTSREEGFGLPPLEALTKGTPVLLTDIPVYREIYGRWAQFFPAGDALALAELISDLPEQPAYDLERARQVSEEFSWTRAAELTERVYEDAVNG